MPAGAAAAAALRPAARGRRHGGQRHRAESPRGSVGRLLVEEARGMLADGLCGASLVAPPSGCPGASAGPGWSPASASTAASDGGAPPIPGDLELPAAAVDVWPSVREATREAGNGWDFCSQASNSDDDSCCWEEESGARLALEPEDLSEAGAGSAAWLVVVGAAAAPVEEDAQRGQASRRTFAEALLAREQEEGAGAPAAAAGGPLRGPPAGGAAGRGPRPARGARVTFADGDECFSPKIMSHGWKKEHKAPRSARAQRKLERQSAQRAEQSCRARGRPEEEGCPEERREA